MPTKTIRCAAATLTLAGAFVPLADEPAAAAVFTVGAGGDCTNSTLGGAIIGAAFTINGEADEIRLTTALVGFHRELRNFDPSTIGELTIRGGFANCSASAPGPGRTSILGNGSDPVFDVVADGAASVVTFENLFLSAGTAANRALTVDGPAEVSLTDVALNSSRGGLLATSGATVELDPTTEIYANDSANLPGGGISCSGSTIRSGARIYDNQTTSSGGGVSLGAGCSFRATPGSFVYDNEAFWGGGFDVAAGSELVSDPLDPALFWSIQNNVAVREGGGVYVVGGGSAMLRNTLVVFNQAGERGAGLFVDGNSELFMTADHALCPTTLSTCSSLSNNTIYSDVENEEGIALYAGGNSTVGIFQTRVWLNSSATRSGTALLATDFGTRCDLEGIELWNNDTVSLFEARVGAELAAAFVSAARNEFGIGTVIASRGAIADNADIEIFSSALDDHSLFVNITGGTISVDCTLAQTVSGTTTVTRSALGDPGFTSGFSGNLTLQATSPAIDYCDAAAYVPLFGDLRGQMRGQDVPSIPNNLGAYDLGAFEVEGSLLFGDGFESGDTTRWSSTVP